MHRGLLYKPKTGVVYATNADYVLLPYTGSRGDSLDNKSPTPTVDTRAYGLYGCREKQSQTLTVWSYVGRHQAEGLLHRTSSALSLSRGLSQSELSTQSSHGNQN